jgi:hypothetical protein
VIVVSCKAWQRGFDATAKFAELRREKKNPKRATWKLVRELWVPKWSESFRDKIFELTGERDFSYRIAVTRLQGDTDGGRHVRSVFVLTARGSSAGAHSGGMA